MTAPSAAKRPTDNDLALVTFFPVPTVAARVAAGRVQEGEVEECVSRRVAALEEERVEVAELLGESGGVDDAGAEEAVG